MSDDWQIAGGFTTEQGDPRDRVANQRELRWPHRTRGADMATETTEMLRVIDRDELEMLAQVRETLKWISDRAVKRAWAAQDASCKAGRVNYSEVPPHNWGRLSEACDVAEQAVFNVLNVSQSACQDTETREMLQRETAPLPPEPAEKLREVVDVEPDYLHDTRDEHDPRL